jgi:isoleucyl-tRNA synthetase
VRRRAAQTVLWRIADALVRAVAPLMSFTADEVWSHLPAAGGKREASVHLATFVPSARLREGLPEKHLKRLENWPRLIGVRDEVLKALETARQQKFIGGALEAKVVLVPGSQLAPLLEEYRAFLPTLFIVSQAEFGPETLKGLTETAVPGLRLRVERAAGKKCDRCWNYSERVGEDADYPMVCERCSAALREIEAAA